MKAFGGIEAQATKRLAILNAAPLLDALRVLPFDRLEALKRDWIGQH